MNTEPLRAAIVGCGRIGTWTRPELASELPPGWLPLNHADAIRAVPGLSLTALCDSDAGNLERARKALGVSRGFADYHALIDEVRPEILALATRTAGRCDIIEYAVRNGVRGIHLEKPISTNLADCARALTAASAAGVRLSYGTTRRFMGVYQDARDRVRAGEIGDLIEIQIQMGRTLLLWNHPHSVDLMIYFSGTPDAEFVQAQAAVNPATWKASRIDDDPTVEHAVVRFSNGVTGVISSASGFNVLICGTTGNLCVGGNGSWLELRRKKTPDDLYFQETRRPEIHPGVSGTMRAFQLLEAAVRTGGPHPVPPEEIAAGQRILLAIARSAFLGGARVSPSELDPGFTVTGRFGELFA